MASSPNVILAGPALPVKSLRDLLETAKKDKVFVSIGSVGSTGHLAGALLAQKASISWEYLPYANPILPLLGSEVSASVYTLAAALPSVRSGDLKALAVTSLKRSEIAPDIPTVAELGFSGFEAIGWYGFAVPIGTPQHIIKILEEATRKAVQKPAVREKLEAMGSEVTFMNSDEFTRFVGKERQMWSEMVTLTGAKP